MSHLAPMASPGCPWSPRDTYVPMWIRNPSSVKSQLIMSSIATQWSPIIWESMRLNVIVPLYSKSSYMTPYIRNVTKKTPFALRFHHFLIGKESNFAQVAANGREAKSEGHILLTKCFSRYRLYCKKYHTHNRGQTHNRTIGVRYKLVKTQSKTQSDAQSGSKHNRAQSGSDTN